MLISGEITGEPAKKKTWRLIDEAKDEIIWKKYELLWENRWCLRRNEGEVGILMFSYTLFVVFCWFLLFCDIILSVCLCLLVWIIFFQLCYVCISILLSLYDFFFLEEQAVHTRKREIKTVSKAQHLLRHNHHEFHRKVFKQVPQDENRRELMNWRNIHQWNST